MEKDVRPYKQRDSTCTICCMMMVLEYYKIITKANSLLEKKYYRLFKSSILEGTPFSIILWYLVNKGLQCEIFHSEKEIFKNDNYLDYETFTSSMEEYIKYLNLAKDKGAKIHNGVDINYKMLKEQLQNDKLVILAGKTSGDYLHAILLCGYNDDSFIVCDPMYRNKQIRTFEDIEDFMSTKIGKWYITVIKK